MDIYLIVLPIIYEYCGYWYYVVLTIFWRIKIPSLTIIINKIQIFRKFSDHNQSVVLFQPLLKKTFKKIIYKCITKLIESALHTHDDPTKIFDQ